MRFNLLEAVGHIRPDLSVGGRGHKAPNKCMVVVVDSHMILVAIVIHALIDSPPCLSIFLA